MALVGRLSEGGVFVQGLFEDYAQVHFAFRALLCMHIALIWAPRAVGAAEKLLATKRSIQKVASHEQTPKDACAIQRKEPIEKID
jgi:hypothetical protein